MKITIPTLFFLFILLFQLSACSGSSLKADEEIIIFPTSANQNDHGEWEVPIHHWVFEKEEGDLSQKVLQKIFSEVFEGLGVSEEMADNPLVKKRVQWFLVDNKRNKRITVLLQNKQENLNKTMANGHANSTIILRNKIPDSHWLPVKVVDKYNRDFVGEVQFIPKDGLSIISDIDDTIKESNVLDKKELIKNTFINLYKTTSGFPEYYKSLKKQGAYFHYVSASPWQIYPSIAPFMAEYYPKGNFSFRNFRLKDSSFIKFLQSSALYKKEQISQIIKRYPNHQFILIGDSGEHDPEVYAEIFQLFPKNIRSIQIRKVKDSDLSEKRFNELYKKVPTRYWKLFQLPTSS